MIGGGYRIGAQHRDPQYSAFQKNLEDVDRTIVFDRLGDLPQIGSEAVALKFSFQHFGESYFRRRATGSAAWPFCRIVDGECGLIQIALELKAGGADETFVLGIVADGGQIFAGIRFACRTQVEIEKCVSAGQQAGGLGRSVLS